ncbi:hypothetical protein CAPTEDRAFT_221137 [Capitella teleta]|uniref:Uncharacterized protein n=1 Tax=Capitella teleta TaxID=283909 RepID=R7US04_CAPTE|nr:hypothetical protein CAPTEDRAFT_221137 [Capitella teleta]|eukprot:ELU09299.1 hypothetical protein CAPTEDRAFT_221137 [Capitella teleta]
MVPASTIFPLLVIAILVFNTEVHALRLFQSSRTKSLKNNEDRRQEGIELRTLAEICSIRECDDLSGNKWAECILSCHETSDLSDLGLEGVDDDDEKKTRQDDDESLRIPMQDEQDDEAVTISPMRRQVDPLQSCIETRCAGRRGSHYTHCILQKCLLELGLGSRFDGRARSLPAAVSSDRSSTTEVLKNAFKKRGVNDITDVCIEYYCPRETPGTLGYLTCVASYRCRGR